MAKARKSAVQLDAIDDRLAELLWRDPFDQQNLENQCPCAFSGDPEALLAYGACATKTKLAGAELYDSVDNERLG
ncbi:MAG: hypothetical protein HYY77_19025 [Betaproteobacteria bacterium]|nr:hypothetical protein [Betaproteobacteria bacterium]